MLRIKGGNYFSAVVGVVGALKPNGFAFLKKQRVPEKSGCVWEVKGSKGMRLCSAWANILRPQLRSWRLTLLVLPQPIGFNSGAAARNVA